MLIQRLHFTYTYHSTKIAGFDDGPEHSSVQINSSSPRLKPPTLCISMHKGGPTVLFLHIMTWPIERKISAILYLV